MAGHQLSRDLENAAIADFGIHGTVDRPALIVGTGVPDNTADVGMVYIDMDGATGDLVLYTWDDTASQWDAMTA